MAGAGQQSTAADWSRQPKSLAARPAGNGTPQPLVPHPPAVTVAEHESAARRDYGFLARVGIVSASDDWAEFLAGFTDGGAAAATWIGRKPPHGKQM